MKLHDHLPTDRLATGAKPRPGDGDFIAAGLDLARNRSGLCKLEALAPPVGATAAK